MYKKIKSLLEIDKVNAELEDEWQKYKDDIVGNCGRCEEFLPLFKGRIQKYDEGSWSKFFCENCFALEEDRMLSHV